MGDDENANKKRKREQQAAAREAGEVQPEPVGGAEVEAEAEAVAMEQDGSESGREDGPSDALRRLLEPFAREQLVEILASAATQFPPVLEEIKAVASADVAHRKVFVRGLAWETQTEHLREAFSTFGDVQEGAVIFDKTTGKSRGYGFVTFVDMEAAMRAVEQQTITILGRQAICNLAAVRSDDHHSHHSPSHSAHVGSSPLAGHTVYTASMNPIYPMMGLPQLPPPNQQQQQGPNSTADRKLFVRGLSWETTDHMLRDEFVRYGEIEEAAIARDRKTGKSRGFGFVTYKQKASADRALAQPQKHIDGRTTICNLASLGNGSRSNPPPPVAPIVQAYAAVPVQQLGMYTVPYASAGGPMPQPPLGYAQYPPMPDPYRQQQAYSAGATTYYQGHPPPPPPQLNGSH